MYIKKLIIEGLRNFQETFSIQMQPGLNVFVGENGSGKSAVIDSVRILLSEDEQTRGQINDMDFNRPFNTPNNSAEMLMICSQFAGLSEEETVAFLPWTDLLGNATLTLQIENRPNKQGRFKKNVWGGASRSSAFESDLFDKINCIYLPPLRDAGLKLKEGRGSRLARLIRNLNNKELSESRKNNTLHPLEAKVKQFNDSLANDEHAVINMANKQIKEKLTEAIGPKFGQDTHIQFSETNFNRIVENLRLLFYPELTSNTPKEFFRNLDENSLGLNNLLYLATVLAELTFPDDDPEYLKILLIEEPEAHLHPQLQIRLLKYLEKVANEKKVQIIVSTHSTILAASARIESLIHLSIDEAKKHISVPLRHCGLKKETNDFLTRWLDATKSTLLFAKGIILVEGISEAMLIPELAKSVLHEYNTNLTDGQSSLPVSLEDAGVSIINMNGIYFEHFMQLFCDLYDSKNLHIPIKCAGITDNDPDVESKPTMNSIEEGKNPARELLGKINSSKNCRLFICQLKTFEYDLAMESNNLNIMSKVAKGLLTTDGSIRATLTAIETKNYDDLEHPISIEEKTDDSFYLLKHIDKGIFAQLLADYLSANQDVSFQIPLYIKSAVIWACGGIQNVP